MVCVNCGNPGKPGEDVHLYAVRGKRGEAPLCDKVKACENRRRAADVALANYALVCRQKQGAGR